MSKYGFDAEELLNEITNISKERPDFIYEGGDDGCSYLGRSIDDPTGQCCIVGQALQNLGVPREDLEEVEGKSVDEVLEALNFSTFKIQDPTVWKLYMIQNYQDSGSSWGESVDRASRHGF